MNFTTEQKQLLYSALMSYGNKLSNMAKEILDKCNIKTVEEGIGWRVE